MPSTSPKRSTHSLAADTMAEQLASIRGARVLLVDDSDVNLEIAAEILRGAGFIIELAENGQVAVTKVKSGHYDLVLMDMQMPVMDGATATREIRDDPRFAELPVVAMSGNVEQSARDYCLAAGMNDHLAKPFEATDLWRVLLKWVEPRHAPTPLARVAVRAPQESDLLLDIGGLDVASGLRRVLGSEPLYLSLLRRFIDGQRHVEQDVALALDVGDRETAGRVAHTLRGVSGNIGATVVQQSAGRLETAIKQRRPRGELNARLDELKSELATLILRLELSLPQERAAATREAVNTQRLDVVCEQLTVLLARDDAEAVEVVLANEELLRAALPCHFRAFEHAVHSFAFDAALTVLREARGSDPRGSRAGAA